MTVELHLPDLPEVPLSLGADPRPRERMAWPLRLRAALSAYLPLLLMLVLALATWWLVKNTPPAPVERTSTASGGLPDYTMQRFTLQRFRPDGRLRIRLEGRELRHFPDADRIEVDEVLLRAVAPDGRVTTATALRAVGNSAASELQLQGGVEVIGTDSAGAPLEIRSEFLQALRDAEVVRTDRPVEVLQGSNRLRAAGLHYDASRQLLQLEGPMRAVLTPPPR